MKTESLREAYGKGLLRLFTSDDRFVVLDSDVSRSTRTVYCAQEDPSRYFEMGISEQNMVGFAAGLAAAGLYPYVHSFAVFCVGRGYDIIRQSICIPKLNVKIVGSSSGLSDTTDGSTHQTVEDIALMRVLPNMTVLEPSDAVETELMVEMMPQIEGPVYMRINRQDLPLLIDRSKYLFGKAYRVLDGSDICIIANGIMLSKALQAAEELKASGISAKVVSLGTIKPLDTEGLIQEVQNMRGVIVAEEHSIIGGLGSAVAECLSENYPLPVIRVGVRDKFGTMSYDYEELLRHYGLTAEAIVKAESKLKQYQTSV